MDIARYIAEKSGLDYRVLFMPETGAVKLVYENATVVIKRWDSSIVGFPQPTQKEITKILAAAQPIDQVAVKQFCQQRIYSVATAQQQQNVNLFVTSNPTEGNKTDFIDFVSWIKAMRVTCNAIIDSGNHDYTQDSLWPNVPPNVLDLVARA